MCFGVVSFLYRFLCHVISVTTTIQYYTTTTTGTLDVSLEFADAPQLDGDLLGAKHLLGNLREVLIVHHRDHVELRAPLERFDAIAQLPKRAQRPGEGTPRPSPGQQFCDCHPAE